jgi:hypothetical protein
VDTQVVPLDWEWIGNVHATQGLAYVNITFLLNNTALENDPLPSNWQNANGGPATSLYGPSIWQNSTMSDPVLARGDVVVIGNETHVVGESGPYKDLVIPLDSYFRSATGSYRLYHGGPRTGTYRVSYHPEVRGTYQLNVQRPVAEEVQLVRTSADAGEVLAGTFTLTLEACTDSDPHPNDRVCEDKTDTTGPIPFDATEHVDEET